MKIECAWFLKENISGYRRVTNVNIYGRNISKKKKSY